jgi:hypothetical protein
MTIRVLSPESGVAKSTQTDSIVLEVSMRNNSDQVVLILEGNPSEYYVIDIRDQSGAHPADTDHGLKLKKSIGSPFKIRNISLRLKPGETGTDVIPIGAMYDMGAPGKYFVTVERKLPKELAQGMVKSNQVAITVTHQK